MKRRDAIMNTAGLAALSALTPTKALSAETAGSLGDVIIPPSQEMGKEKHVPIIDAPAAAKAGEPFDITVQVGKVVKHPNTVEHHIRWIQLYAIEEDSKYVVNLGTFDFAPTYADPKVTMPVMLQKSSTIYALEHCNIHGIWDYAVKITVS